MPDLMYALIKGDFSKEVLNGALLLKGEERNCLFQLAREKRDQYFPSGMVEVRSVIEISNICKQLCNFCSINYNADRKRYLLKHDHVLQMVGHVYQRGRKVLLIQSGENDSQNYINFIHRCILDIKKSFHDLTIILCLGDLEYAQYKQLREAGAERYILKFETSSPKLYEQIKPGTSLAQRIKCLNYLVDLGYEVGTGNIIGLPHQTLDHVVDDLLFLSNFKLTMMSSTVFIPGEDTNYRDEPMGELDLTLNFIALIRIMYPGMLIPTTSSLEKAKDGGQLQGLMAGANTVTIHDGTPDDMKKHFPIYSIKRVTPQEEYIKSIVTHAQLQFPGLPEVKK
jgi:biotin synthase